MRSGGPALAPVFLLADIGGTNLRLSLADRRGLDPDSVCALRVADYPSLEAALLEYLRSRSVRVWPRLAALAVAAPTEGWAQSGTVAMTNHRWVLRRDALEQSLGFSELLVVNDFFAQARALPALPVAAFREVQAGNAPAIPVTNAPGLLGLPRVILGPGTGLGLATLFHEQATWRVFTGEGGHATLSVRDRRDHALVAWAWAHLGARRAACSSSDSPPPHLSVERFLSGEGLRLLWRFHAQFSASEDPGKDPRKDPGKTPAAREIASRAQEGACSVCVAALDHFCSLLGTAASNAALTIGASGGVYLAGGILPQIETFFLRSSFLASFNQKGRFAYWLQRTPVYLVLDDRASLSGCWQMALEQFQ